MVEKVKTEAWFTADGREFDNKEDAKKHEAFVNQIKAFEAERKKTYQLLFETQKTRDGVPFKLKHSGKYYYVHEFAINPYIEEIDFFYYDIEFNECDQLAIGKRYNENRFLKFYISDLYDKKTNAEIKLIKVMEEKIDSLKQWVAKQKKRGEK